MPAQKIVATALMLVFITWMGEVVHGQSKYSKGHLKKSNPNELYVSYSEFGECNRSFETVVDNELAQARIKKSPYWIHDELVLFVSVSCLKLKGMPNQTVFNLSIHFGRFVTPIDPQPDEFDFVTVRYGSSYGFIGITTNDSSGEQYLTNSLREAVEAALGDYLKINFDL